MTIFGCDICGKRKRDGHKPMSSIRYVGINSCLTYASVHFACLEDVITNPEKYSTDTLWMAVQVLKGLRQQLLDRKKKRTTLLDEAKTLNLELFLDKAKGEAIEQQIDKN